MVLKKLITKNNNITSVIGSSINEYDIKSAHPTAMRYLRGEKMYEKLMAMPKLERNILIGKMIADDNKKKGSLYKDIESLLMSWMNDFMEVNKIQTHNFIETTRDSVMIVNKIPRQLNFDKGKIRFVDKDGTFTTLFRFNGKLLIFDSMRQKIRIKGVDDQVTQASPFVKQYLVPLVTTIESYVPLGPSQVYRVLARYRNKYINPKSYDIYKELNNSNHFSIQFGDDILQIDAIDESVDPGMIKHDDNYINYVMPIMKAAVAF